MAMLPVRDTVVVMTFVSDTGDLEMETPHQAGVWTQAQLALIPDLLLPYLSSAQHS